jgi:serine/threonine-protein kinase
MTAPDDALVLSQGTVIVAVSELPASAREGLDLDAHGAFAVTRQHDRSSSTLVDERLAALLAEFRSPSTVVEAIIRYSRRAGIDAEGALDDAYPALRRCIRHGYLVPEGSELSKPIEPAFVLGQRIAGGTVARSVRVLDDAELHQLALDAGGMAALKVLRRGRPTFGVNAMRREARLLRHLDGRVAPRLLAEGESEHFGWLTMQWCDGHNAAVEAAALRASGRRTELLELCVAVAEAYAELHQLGVVHGDVHPGNVIVAPDGDVRLIDFGLARWTGAEHGDDLPPRGGVHAFYDPQHAAAVRAGRRAGPASYGSDQYSLAAMLYELICGSPYIELSIEISELLRQVVEEPPLPFTRRGHEPWPAVEKLLAASLAKNPADRLASTRELARRLALVHAPAGAVARPTSVEWLLDMVLARASPGGSWFEEGLSRGAPRCSVAYGAAGLAAAIYRVAVLRADPGLLTLADEWAVRAAREAGKPGAFSSTALGLTQEQTGPVSPFHSLTGVHVVEGLTSHALGDVNGRQRAVDAFVRESRQPCAALDLTLGRSGTLLAAALLLEVMSGARYAQLDALVALGNDTLIGVWEEIDATAPIPDATAVAYLGVAHGWAGMLLASLRWCASAGTPLPRNLLGRLDELAQLAQPIGLGARWPQENRQRRGRPPLHGWCHGSAGYVHLWTTAHDQLGGERWATLAEQAAWHAHSSHGGAAHLCCGHAGQAYGILEIYRHTGDRRWLAAAHELAARAASAGAATLADAPIAASLHKGVAGIAALAADLGQPELAAMPFFGRER